MASVKLARTWVNLVSTGEAVSAYTGRGRSRSTSKDGDVRKLAGGRYRGVSSRGTKRTQAFMLRDVSPFDITTLEQWIDQTVLIRDNRGRRMFGIFYAVEYSDKMNPQYYDVTLNITEVSFEEGVA